MMDLNALAGMVFTLVLAGLIGGFILMYPLVKRVGALMESKTQAEKKGTPAPSLAEVRKLAESVTSLEAEIHLLKERQEFTENLLTQREPQKLPAERQGG